MNLPPHPQSEQFNPLVWDIVRLIPPGKVATYGQIAALIPPSPGIDEKEYNAFRARWVGEAMSRCPKDVPWQRVINSQGKISLSRSNQRLLLEAEGIEFDAKDRVDLRRFQWEGPDPSHLKKLGLPITRLF